MASSLDGRSCIGDSAIADVDGPIITADWAKESTTIGGPNALFSEAEVASCIYDDAVDVVAAGAVVLGGGEWAAVVAAFKLGYVLDVDVSWVHRWEWSVVHKAF